MKYHKLANIFPMMTDAELDGLRADMRANGYRAEFPVWIYEELILDGRNRWRAAELEGIKPVTREYKGADPLAFVLSANKERRHLSSSQLAFVALEVEKVLAVEAEKRQKSGKTLSKKLDKVDAHDNTSSEQAARIVGTNRQYVADAKKLQAEAPALAEQVKAGVLTIPEARKQARKDETQRQRADIAKKADAVIPSDRYHVYLGDIQTWQAPRQYDFIITDPPYPKEFLPLYGVLAERAKEWLKPGGLLVAMCGQSYLNQIMRLMDEHLTYWWMGAYLTPGGQSAQVFPRMVNPFWKPLLIYSNGKYTGKWFGDVFKSDVNANEKELHHWGQSESGMLSIVSKFANPGDYILDPFCGSGTTGIAALNLGCFFDGLDIDQENVNTSMSRLANA